MSKALYKTTPASIKIDTVVQCLPYEIYSQISVSPDRRVSMDNYGVELQKLHQQYCAIMLMCMCDQSFNKLGNEIMLYPS